MAWKRLGSQIVAQSSDAEVMLADLQLGTYYRIGGSGTEMWNAIDMGCSRDQIVERLESIYEAQSETLDDALTDFVDTLVDFDLIKPSGALAEQKSAPKSSQTKKHPFVVPVVSRVERSDSELFDLCKLIKWQPASAEVVWNCQGQVTLVQVYQGVSYKLSGTAKDIWLGLCAGYTRQALIDALTQRFATSTEQIIASELDGFIVKLAQRRLIQPADSEQTEISSLPPSDTRVWETPQMVATEGKAAAVNWISTHRGWEPAAPRIAAEIIDNEVVIVDLKAGIYTSITGAGTVVWQALSAGQLNDGIVRTLQSGFDMSAKDAAKEVDSVVAKLVEYALIRPRKTGLGQQSQPDSKEPAKKSPFEPSQITRHHDMEDALRLDPVHDFDEYGWPNRG